MKNASILEDKLLTQIKKEKELIESRKETIDEDLDFLKFFENDNNSLKFDEKLFTFLVKKDTELPNIYYLYDYTVFVLSRTSMHDVTMHFVMIVRYLFCIE